LSLLDPVRAFEDYSTLDHLSGGRLELMIGAVIITHIIAFIMIEYMPH
jgi:alkanesulfonate monooxygenase SsuD/methylene tetrahydromethanopterin reductase-like flavin-dependent oxidoreductase (luciferase family)